MGDEARCTVRFGDATSEGKALLETDELVFRGDFRLAIPFAGITALDAADGILMVGFSDGEAAFELGPKAARWADRIQNPRTLLDKLGVKPDSRVAVVGVDDSAFRELLEERVSHLTTAPEPESDLIFLGVESVDQLERIDSLAQFLTPAGGLWVLAPKGRKDIREMDVLEAGRAAGLKDTKVAKFSETHTAHRFVIPIERR